MPKGVIMKTVHVTYQLVREFALTTIPGEAVALAEAVGTPVWAAPACELDPFPEDHPLQLLF
jgi:hypothetical protein